MNYVRRKGEDTLRDVSFSPELCECQPRPSAIDLWSKQGNTCPPSDLGEKETTQNGTAERQNEVPRCFVIDLEEKQLDPTWEPKAWRFIRTGKAKLVRRYPMTIQLFRSVPQEEINTDKITIGIDDGTKHIGIAAVIQGKTRNIVLLRAEAEQRGDVKKLLEIRKGYRRNRRYNKRYRPKRFNNRAASRRKGRVAPSILQKRQVSLRIVSFLAKVLRIDRICLEDTAFDIRALTDGYKPYRWQYQASNRLDENIRKAVIMRDGNKCALCGKKNGVLEVHHITPRRFNGSDTYSNLIALCGVCRDFIKNREMDVAKKLYKKIGGKNIPDLVYAQHVMQGKTWLREKLSGIAELVLTNGGETANHRIDWNLKKSHSTDAVCCTGLCPYTDNVPEFYIKPLRRKTKAKERKFANGITFGDYVSYTDSNGILWKGYVKAIYDNKAQINIKTRVIIDKKVVEKNRVNAKKCHLLQRPSRLNWFM